MDKTRLTLLKAIEDPDNREKWDDFYKAYRPYVKSICRSSGLSENEWEEVISAVFMGFAKGKIKYDPTKGMFRCLLKAVTSRRCMDKIRMLKREQAGRINSGISSTGQPSTATIELIPDPRTRTLHRHAHETWREMVKERARDAVKRRVSPKQYQLYHARFVEELPVREIMATYKVTRNQVDLAVHRVKPIMVEETKRAAQEFDKPKLPKTK